MARAGIAVGIPGAVGAGRAADPSFEDRAEVARAGEAGFHGDEGQVPADVKNPVPGSAEVLRDQILRRGGAECGAEGDEELMGTDPKQVAEVEKLDRMHMAPRSREGYWRMSEVEIGRFALRNRWLEEKGVPDLRVSWMVLHYGSDARV